MSQLQKATLKRFKKAVGRKTFNEYASLTGIERTRIFRLFNGAEMKLAEFEVFQTLLMSYQKGVDWKEVLEEAQLAESSPFYSKDLKSQLERTKRLNEYLEHNIAA